MYFRVIVAVILMVHFQYISAYEYCRKDRQTELCGEKEHIFCHPEQLVKKDLGELYGVVPMTPLLKRKLIDFHNTVRNKIACGFTFKYGAQIERFPKASAMRKVIWDDELQFLAEIHVGECNEQRDNCHETLRFSNTGQNLCKKTDNVSMPIVELMDVCLNEWFNEHMQIAGGVFEIFSHLQANLWDEDRFDNYKRFTHMVMDDTSRIGCGISLCKKEDLDERFNYLMVCNYDEDLREGGMYYEISDEAANKCHRYESKRSPKYECLCTNNGKIYSPLMHDWDTRRPQG